MAPRRSRRPDFAAALDEARIEFADATVEAWVTREALLGFWGKDLEWTFAEPLGEVLPTLRAYLRQAQHRLQHTTVRIRPEIRVHREELVAARRKVDYYRETVLPRTESLAILTMEQYNAMLIGTYQLLETRSEQVHVGRAYVEAVRDYWVERSALELATGGQPSDKRGAGGASTRAGHVAGVIKRPLEAGGPRSPAR